MRSVLRAMVVPFCMALFPSLWYVNRNLTSEVLAPQVEPTPSLVVGGIAASVAGSAVFSVVIASFRRRDVEDESALPRHQRVLQPDDTALSIFAALVGLVAVWALVDLVGLGPSWLATILQVLLIPLAAPFLLLAPLAIAYHWAVILGLVMTPIWMSLLSTVASDVFQQRFDAAD